MLLLRLLHGPPIARASLTIRGPHPARTSATHRHPAPVRLELAHAGVVLPVTRAAPAATQVVRLVGEAIIVGWSSFAARTHSHSANVAHIARPVRRTSTYAATLEPARAEVASLGGVLLARHVGLSDSGVEETGHLLARFTKQEDQLARDGRILLVEEGGRLAQVAHSSWTQNTQHRTQNGCYFWPPCPLAGPGRCQ